MTLNQEIIKDLGKNTKQQTEQNHAGLIFKYKLQQHNFHTEDYRIQ